MTRSRNRPPYFWWPWWMPLKGGKPGDSVTWRAREMPLREDESSKAVLDSLARAGKAMQFAGLLKYPTQVRRMKRDGQLYFQLALVEERKRTGWRREVPKPRLIPLARVQEYESKPGEPVKTAKMLLLEKKHAKPIDELIIEACNHYGFRGACDFLGVADPTLTRWAEQSGIVFFQGAAKREKLEELGVRILPPRGLPLQEPQE